MEFQDYAATETSALVGRLLGGQAVATLQQLQAIKEAIEAVTRAIEAAPQPEQEIDELVARLTAASSEEVRRAGDESRRISQEARRAIDEAETALQLQVEENAGLASAIAKADAEAALLKSELATAQDRADSTERDFLATVDAHGEVEAALKISESEKRHLAHAKSHLEAEFAQTRATLNQALADVNHLRDDVDHHQARRDELEQQLAAAHHVALERDTLLHDLERIREERAALHQQMVAAAAENAAQRDALARDIEAAGNRTHVLEIELESAHGRIVTLEAELAAANGRTFDVEAQLAAAHGRSHDIEAQLAAINGRSSDVEAQLTAVNGRAGDLEKQLAAANSHFGDLEKQLAIANTRAGDLETQVTAANSRAGDLETQVTAANSRAGDLETQVTVANSRAGDLEKQVTVANNRAGDLEKQVTVANSRAGDFEKQVAAASSRAGDLEKQVTVANSRAGDLEKQVTVANSRAGDLEKQVTVANSRAGDFEKQVTVANGRAGDLEKQVTVANNRAGDLEKQLHGARGRATALEHDLAAAIAAVERHDVIVTELEMSRARAHTLEAERADREDAIRQLQLRLDDALQAEARLREQAETKLREAAARASEATSDAEQSEALRWEVERMVSLFDASVRAVNEMASARTAADLHSELVKRLSLQFSRVALFRVRGQALEGELQVGFEDTDVSKLVLPMTMDSLLTRAVNTGAVGSITGSDISRRLGTPFNGSPTSAVALPIMTQGTSVAVVYADDADMPDYARGPAVHESSVAFAKLLVGEAALLMMCHTHELKMLAELRQYATTLLDEAKEMYQADAEAGRPTAQLRARLKDNLECASQLYTYRAAMEGTAAAALLDEEIAAETTGTSQFARDLGEVMRTLSKSDLRITAEAS